jgi:hypothetical protein
MKDFLLAFRMDYTNMPDPSTEQAQAMSKRWMDWIGGIAAQGKLASQGNRLEGTGKVLKPNNVVTNGPFTEIKESLGGFSIIKADSYEAAIEIAKGCPILNVGGSVEVREVGKMQ